MADVHVPDAKSEAAIIKPPREALAFLPKNLDEMWRISEMVSKSGLAPPALCGKPYDVQLVLMTGWELGLTTTQALRDIDVVKGRPYMRALLKVALVKQSPLCRYFRMVESTDKKAVFETHREGEGVTRFEFTVEDADRAGVLGRSKDGKPLETDNWTKWLRLMLRRRCSSQLADEVYPDVVRGIGDREDIDEEKERELNPAPLRGVGPTSAPPPPEEAQVVPPPSPPQKERKLKVADVPGEATVPPVETLKETVNPARAKESPVESTPMDLFEATCIRLRECADVEQVDKLSMNLDQTKFTGDQRNILGQLIKSRRKALGGSGK